jgi:hypothetical protein
VAGWNLMVSNGLSMVYLMRFKKSFTVYHFISWESSLQASLHGRSLQDDQSSQASCLKLHPFIDTNTVATVISEVLSTKSLTSIISSNIGTSQHHITLI